MITCPVCGAEAEAQLVEKRRAYRLCRCAGCDVVFCDPFRAHESVWYESSTQYERAYLSARLYWHHRHFLADPPEGRTLLDVGCNNGAFLSAAREFGFDGIGIDFNGHAVEAGKQIFKIDRLHACTLEQFAERFPDSRFDVITAFEVLEHLDRPRDFMRTVKKLLRPGGRLCVSVPNRDMVCNPLGETDYPPHHLTKWSAKSLQLFLGAHGFHVVSLCVKQVSAEDMARWIDYNFLRRIDRHVRERVRRKVTDDMKRTGLAANPDKVSLLARMRAVEMGVLSGLCWPFSRMFRILGKQGFGLFAQAQDRDE